MKTFKLDIKLSGVMEEVEIKASNLDMARIEGLRWIEELTKDGDSAELVSWGY